MHTLNPSQLEPFFCSNLHELDEEGCEFIWNTLHSSEIRNVYVFSLIRFVDTIYNTSFGKHLEETKLDLIGDRGLKTADMVNGIYHWCCFIDRRELRDIEIAKMCYNGGSRLQHKSNLWYLIYRQRRCEFACSYFVSENEDEWIHIRCGRLISIVMYLYFNPDMDALLRLLEQLELTIHTDPFFHFLCRRMSWDPIQKQREIVFNYLRNIRVTLIQSDAKSATLHYSRLQSAMEWYYQKYLKGSIFTTPEIAKQISIIYRIIRSESIEDYFEEQESLLATRTPKIPVFADLLGHWLTQQQYDDKLILIVYTNMDLMLKLRTSRRGCQIIVQWIKWMMNRGVEKKKDAHFMLVDQIKKKCWNAAIDKLQFVVSVNRPSGCSIWYCDTPSECPICYDQIPQGNFAIKCLQCVEGSTLHYRCAIRLQVNRFPFRCAFCRHSGYLKSLNWFDTRQSS